jgi:hypothetical protein
MSPFCSQKLLEALIFNIELPEISTKSAKLLLKTPEKLKTP